MPEWGGNVITAVCSAGFVSALFAGWLKWSKQRHEQGRQSRGDEIDVLHDSIRELRLDRDRLTKAADRRDMEIGRLRDEHTRCLVDQTRLQEANAQLGERVAKLESQIADLLTPRTGG